MSSVNARVPPSRLAAIDSPADGEVAAYQASSGQFEWVANGSGGGGSVTSVALTETGSALTITGSPITGAGTFNIAGAGSSSQVILGDLTLATLPTGTIGGSSTANQISFGDTTANEITSSGNLQFLSGQNLYVGGRIQIGNATGTKLTTVTSQNLILDTDDGSNSGNITIEAGTNGQISITPDGTGLVKIDGVGINNSAIATNYILKATSATEAGWVAESAGGGFTGSLADTQVAFGNTTADSIQGSSDFTFGSNILKIGGASGSATFTSGGTGFTKIGVNSGSSSEAFIFIPSGASGNLQLNAGGTGTASPLGVVQVGQSNMGVEISRAYTLPKVVTAANDYVLTAQTDGTTAWAASGGGGGGIGGSITDNQVAVGATTADEIEGSSDFTYNASTDTLTVGEKIDSSGTSPLQLIAGSSSISILDGGVANHITISPASGRINAQSSTLSVGTDSADATISSSGAYNLTLNTNDGTNSGSIVIADGVNGQISITPNGTGTIKLDGVELDNSAIATGYVLKATSATAAGWAAESGGGSTPKFSGVKANTNAYYDLSSYPTGWRTTTYTNVSETQSAPIYSPFTCGIDLTLGTLGIEVSVAGDAGLNYLLAIYSVDAAGLPDSKLVSATVSADATGTQTGTITETSAGDGDLVAGTQYYYAYTQSFDATSNPSLRSAGAQFNGAFTDTTIGTQRQAIRAGVLGTLPATYPGSGVVLGTSIAIVGCTYG